MRPSVFGLALAGLVLSSFLVARAQAQPIPDPDYQLRITSAAGLSGDRVEVSVILDFPNGQDVSGGSFNVCTSPGDDSVVSVPCNADPDDIGGPCANAGVIVLGADLLTVNNGNVPSLWYVWGGSLPEGWGAAFVVNFLGNFVLPVEENAELFVARYDLVGEPGESAELTICEIGDPKRLLSLGIAGGGDVVPETQNGIIEILPPGIPFVRGDVDSDGEFDAIPDVLYLLNSGFIPGSPVASCVESADIDGDGVRNTLADAFFALNCQFIPGSPCPPAPFPECGLDPSPGDTLGCDSAGCP